MAIAKLIYILLLHKAHARKSINHDYCDVDRENSDPPDHWKGQSASTMKP